MAGKVTIKSNRILELKAQMKRNALMAARKAAFDIEAGAKGRIRVDTGAGKNSIYVVLSDGESNYSDAASAARAANPGVELFGQSKPPQGRAWVVVAVVYGAVLELGGHKRAASPYMAPSAEQVRPSFEAAMQSLFNA